MTRTVVWVPLSSEVLQVRGKPKAFHRICRHSRIESECPKVRHFDCEQCGLVVYKRFEQREW